MDSESDFDIDSTVQSLLGTLEMDSIGGEEEDSPLDFSSAPKKVKLEPELGSHSPEKKEDSIEDVTEEGEGELMQKEETKLSSPSGCKLRKILNMKSSMLTETSTSFSGAILNLSKKQGENREWLENLCKARRSSDGGESVCSNKSSRSNSCSPNILNSPSPFIPLRTSGGEVLMHTDQLENEANSFIMKRCKSSPTSEPSSPPSRRDAIGKNEGNSMVIDHRRIPPISLTGLHPLNFQTYGVPGFNPNVSPVGITQPIPNVGTAAIPISSLETSPTLFNPHRVSNGVGSPSLPFGTSLAHITSNSTTTPTPTLTSKATRATRPFKAYPKDPLTFPSVGLYGLPVGSNSNSTEALLQQQSNNAYAEFRKQMLSQSQSIRNKRGGNCNLSPEENKPPLQEASNGIIGISDSKPDGNIHNSSHSPFELEDHLGGGKTKAAKMELTGKDDAYWERRRKNNEAAKRSRDARRAKEDEIAIRAAFLEQENLKLRFELSALKNETAKLRCMLYSS